MDESVCQYKFTCSEFFSIGLTKYKNIEPLSHDELFITKTTIPLYRSRKNKFSRFKAQCVKSGYPCSIVAITLPFACMQLTVGLQGIYTGRILPFVCEKVRKIVCP